jgi:hypothetical protein
VACPDHGPPDDSSGEIPYHKMGGKYLFTQEELSSYLESAAVPARKPAKEAGNE